MVLTAYFALSTVAMVRDRDFSDQINHFASYSGFTALHYAVVVDDEALIQYLLEHGADPTVENNLGLAPSNYCTNERAKALLEEYTVKVCCIIFRGSALVGCLTGHFKVYIG